MLSVLFAAILINEVQSSDGDWIELHNDGQKAVNVTGWGLSDKETNLFKYRLSGWMNPNGYLKVSEPFGISNTGETLYLTAPGEVAPRETVVVPPIPSGVTWGRAEVGAAVGQGRFFPKGTPGKKNVGNGYAEAEEMAPVVFSVPRGICAEPFDLVLSHPKKDVRIYYTLNHDDPSETTGCLYTEPIRIDHTCVVRAVAVREGVLGVRGSTTHTYVFPADIPRQVKPACAPEVWEDYEKSCAASYGVPSEAWEPTALEHLPIVSVTLSDAALFDPTNGLYCKPLSLEGVERVASYEVVNENRGCNAGFRIQGAAGRYFSIAGKKSFGIRFREEYGPKNFDGENALVFRTNWYDAWPRAGATYVRDQLARDLQRATSGYGATGDFVHVFLNGLYWGVYNRCQRADARLAAATFGGKHENYTTVKFAGETPQGNNAAYRAFVANVSNLTWSAICHDLDVPAFADYMLLENVICNLDWPDNNFIVAHSPADGVKYHYFVWDSENTYSTLSMVYRFYYGPRDKKWCPQNIHLALLQRAEYRKLIGEHARHHLLDPDGSLTVAAITNRIVKLGAQLEVPIRAEGARWGTPALTTNFPTNIAELCRRAEKRHGDFVQQLQTYRLLAATAPSDLSEGEPTFVVPQPDPEVVVTETRETVVATLGGTTLERGLATAEKISGVLKAERVELRIPTLKGGATWYGGLVARDLPGAKKCVVRLADGREPENAVYYLSSKVSAGDGRVTYCVSLPHQVRYETTSVWVYETGTPLGKPVFSESAEGLNDVFTDNHDGTVSWCVHTYQGLSYRIESGSTLDPSAWTTTASVPGTGLPLKLRAPAYRNGGFYRIVVETPH